MTEISTDAGNIIYTAPRSVVSVADALREADFTEVPYLHCELLHVVMAPEVDQAKLVYEYGRILREDASAFDNFDKLNIVGKYVKVEIVDTAETPLDPIVWYGVIEAESKDVWGSRDEIPTGVQIFAAFGLLRIAERTPIRETVIEDPADDSATITVKHALPFNQDAGGIYVRRGNRSTSEIDGTYVFSPQQRSLTAWDAYQAVRYLLDRFAPLDKNDLVANEWALHSSVIQSWLDWYDIAVECEGHTLKECLDALIDRKRGVGYFAKFDPNTDKIEIHVTSFVDADVTLPTGKILVANPDQYSLDFEAALDIDSAIVNTVGTTQYHQVIARGAKRTTTFTASLIGFENGIGVTVPVWVPDWTSAEVDEFLAGASGEPGYDDLEGDAQERANALWRSSDRMRNVFTRWKINPQWNMLVRDITGEDSTEWYFCPVIPTDPADDVDKSGGDQSEVWKPGMRVLRALPFLDRYDYSGTKIDDGEYGAAFSQEEQPDFIPPMAILESLIEGSNPPEFEYELLDKTNLAKLERGWAASFRISDTDCAIELKASPQQMLGKQEWEDGEPAATADTQDPTLADGADWRNVRVTACLEIDEHIEQMEQLGDDPPSSVPIAILLINVPDARFDYVVPFTVVECKGGTAVQTLTGGAVRDDRERLAAIAQSAAQWYGRNRQTLELTYKQVRGLFELGWLITSVGANYSLTDINTVVTSVTYVLDSQTSVPTTTVKTSFADLDVTYRE